SVTLHYSTDGTTFIAKPMGKDNRYDRFYFEFVVKQPLDYYLTAADAESRHYHLDVQPEPMVVDINHDLAFPEYTALAKKTGISGGNIEALEGTIFTVHAKTNEPVRKAWLEFTRPTAQLAKPGGKANEPEIIPATISETDSHEVSAIHKVTSSGQYKIKFETT